METVLSWEALFYFMHYNTIILHRIYLSRKQLLAILHHNLVIGVLLQTSLNGNIYQGFMIRDSSVIISTNIIFILSTETLFTVLDWEGCRSLSCNCLLHLEKQLLICWKETILQCQLLTNYIFSFLRQDFLSRFFIMDEAFVKGIFLTIWEAEIAYDRYCPTLWLEKCHGFVERSHDSFNSNFDNFLTLNILKPLLLLIAF